MSQQTGSNLTDQVTIITGASGGIGLACAKRLLNQHHKVVLVDINPEKLASAVEELVTIAPPEQILSLVLSVCDENDMAAMASKTVAHFGRIDNLIACAGILRVGEDLKTIWQTSLEEWRAVIETNLTGTFLSNRAVIPAMIEQKQGDIINISSVSGRQGRPFDGPYCASKFGIIGLSESLSEEVSAWGVRVQTILPDAIDTPLWNQNGPSVPKPTYALPPERVAEFISYLLSLPRDTFLLNPVLMAFKSRKKRPKIK